MPRKNPKGPKWGHTSTVWTAELPQLSDEHRRRLFDIVDDPVIVDQLARAFKHFTVSDHSTREEPSPGDQRAMLREIEEMAEALRWRLARIGWTAEAALDEKLFYQGDTELTNRLQADLHQLRLALWAAERDLLETAATGRPSAASPARGLAQEIGRILEHNGISTSRYDQSPWCRVLRILLEAAGHPVANVRHLLKQQE